MTRHDEIIEADEIFDNAEKAYAENNMQEAERLLRQVIQINPYFSYAYQLLAQIKASTGKYADAIRILEQCIQLDSGFAHAYYLMAKYLYRTGSIDDAVKKLDIAIRTSPSSRLYKAVKTQLLQQKNTA